MARSRVLDSKNQIIDVAFSIVDKDGADDLSTRRIAKELKVSTMTLYNYVQNVEEIKKEVLIKGVNILFASIYEKMRNCDFNDANGGGRMAAYCRAYAYALFEFAGKHKSITRYMIGEGKTHYVNEAELRPFYHSFDVFYNKRGLSQEESADIEKKCKMFQWMVLSMIHEYIDNIYNMSEEEVKECINLYISKMLCSEQ